MKKKILAIILGLGFTASVATVAMAHDVFTHNPAAFSNPPSMSGGLVNFLGYAQIDACVETGESAQTINNNCGNTAHYQTGFKAKVSVAGQVHTAAGWLAVTPVLTRTVTMGNYRANQGTAGYQIYGSAFASFEQAPCPENLHGYQVFRTRTKMGYNWHGVWGWTSWFNNPGPNPQLYCP